MTHFKKYSFLHDVWKVKKGEKEFISKGKKEIELTHFKKYSFLHDVWKVKKGEKEFISKGKKEILLGNIAYD